MKRILFIHHAAGWGGAPNCMLKLIQYLDRTKYTAEVLLLKNSIVADKLTEARIRYKVAGSSFYRKFYHFFAHSDAGKVRWYRIDSYFMMSISWLLSRYYFAGKELSRHEFDIVHLNSSVLTDWMAPASKLGKVIIHVREPFSHGKFDLLHHFFSDQMKKYADQIIAISEDNANRVCLPFKTKVIYDFAEVPARVADVNSYSSRKVLYLGGSSPSKGFYTLVDALDYLDESILIYFGGEYVITEKHGNIIQIIKYHLSKARKRNAAIEKISKHPKAKVIGMVYNVNDYLDEVCCMVSPFAVPHFSDPVIESYLHRKPAIGSDVKGMEEIIENNLTGLIFRKNDPVKLAMAINNLVDNPQRAKLMGEAGYKIAISKFTPLNISQIENVYDKIIS